MGELKIMAIPESTISHTRLRMRVTVEYCVSRAVTTGIVGSLRKCRSAPLKSATEVVRANSMPMDSTARDNVRMVSESRVSTSATNTVRAFIRFAVCGKCELSGNTFSRASASLAGVKGTDTNAAPDPGHPRS